ncbi:MAG: GMC family oxidoreductase [Chroococcidiopsidaceae cyanobacterium CP_BM_ER_R8_30]|nr:GMC family oxidoreductase [Chroococcidiopsidaceae cyanobacterium CP_BM_ER_R8_30]
MLVDARKLSVDEVIETEVCIIGAGPAGITLAREFAHADFRVALLESGGLEFNQNTQLLAEGESVGHDFGKLETHRCRQFGGTANWWEIKIPHHPIGVRYVPLDKIDFEQRDWLPYSGWPFNKSHLDPFYERAQSVCQIGPFAYDAAAWSDAGTPQLPLNGERVTTTMFQFGPRTAFTKDGLNEINQASNITTYLNANVLEIETNATARTITRVRVACLEGNEFWVCAKVFILATGAMENAQLLLLSNKQQQTGLGNHNDLVGRFFMDHPFVDGGLLLPADPQIFKQTALYDLRLVNHVAVMGKLTLTEAVMHHEQLLNISALLFPRPKSYQSLAANSLEILRKNFRDRELPQDFSKHFSNVIVGLDYILPAVYRRLTKQQNFFPNLGSGGWSYLQANERRFVTFEVLYFTEQAPNPNNRVMLSTQRDRLGRRQVLLHNRVWSDMEISSIKRAQAIFTAEIARAGLGQLQTKRDGELPRMQGPGAHHHMGTTRMHNDPKQGVVDENCQVHGISNLFIAGSSVFPTGGFANPTLTIIALSIRLADHVKIVMAQQKPLASIGDKRQ